MIPEHMKGAPLVALIIVILAVGYMVGIHFAFQGSIHY